MLIRYEIRIRDLNIYSMYKNKKFAYIEKHKPDISKTG